MQPEQSARRSPPHLRAALSIAVLPWLLAACAHGEWGRSWPGSAGHASWGAGSVSVSHSAPIAHAVNAPASYSASSSSPSATPAAPRPVTAPASNPGAAAGSPSAPVVIAAPLVGAQHIGTPTIGTATIGASSIHPAAPAAPVVSSPIIALRPPALAPPARYGFAAARSRSSSARPLAALLELFASLFDSPFFDAPPLPPELPAEEDGDAAPAAAPASGVPAAGAPASDEPAPPEPGDLYGADLGEDTCADLAPGSKAPRGCAKGAPITASGSGAAASPR